MEQTRSRLAIAGASSYFGAAVCDALVDRFDITVLTRSTAKSDRTDRNGRIRWQLCDLFSRNEVERALQGADFAVYLVHNREPSARLDQALAHDMDLLVADNFGRGASRAGVRQIVYRSQLVSDARAMPVTSKTESEILQTLSSYGVPVTTLRTGLVVGSGGELMRLLVRLVELLPVIPIPRWAQTERRPISLADLLNAYSSSVGVPDTFGNEYDVFGRESLSLQRMLEETAWVLGLQRTYVFDSALPEWCYRVLLRIIHPTLHPDRLTYILEALKSDTVGRENTVQLAVAERASTFRHSLEEYVRKERTMQQMDHHYMQRGKDDEVLKAMGRVRSIQRLKLPAGKTADWLADYYYTWLGHVLRPFIKTVRFADGSWSVLAFPRSITLLTLTFQPGHSSPDRYLYFITGGLLARFLGGRKARLEFRAILKGEHALVAIHDFKPALPWFFYRYTQAVGHGLLMKAFQRHMARIADSGHDGR